VKYEGDIIIGNGRSYAKMVLIVEDAVWEQIHVDEKAMALLHYDKENPKHALRDFHVDAVQLVEMK
jgi:hypothetical protein